MARRALLVGCLYSGTKHILKGCVNDCLSMREMLVNHYGFPPENVHTLLETEPANGVPTGGNIKRKLAELVAASVPGDVLVFHYSGHGVQVPCRTEDDGKDEALCPTDLNVITDDDLRRIVQGMPEGVNFTMIADCCHSGTLLDHKEVVISGPKAGEEDVMPPALGDILLALMGRGDDERESTIRAIPTNDYVSMLAEKLGVAAEASQVREMLKQAFGEDATSKVQGVIQKVGDAVLDAVGQVQAAAAAPEGVSQKGMGSLLGGLAAQLAATAIESIAEAAANQPPPPQQQQQACAAPPGEPLPDNVGVLITGCQSHETSADAHPPGKPEAAFGALTNALTTTVKEFKAAHPDANISYRTLVSTIRENLTRTRFAQNPCLEGSEKNADAPFILFA